MKINVKTTNNYFERTETLVKYYHDVLDYDVVDAAREKELFTLLNEGKRNLEKANASGDKELARNYEKEVKGIRDFIINSNLRFVISVARIYATNNNLLDIIDEGNVGLVKAVDSFDVTLGNRFQTHAIHLIRQQINIFRQNDGLMIRKNNESKTYHIIRNMTNKFMQEFQREPTSEELKDYINEHYPNANIKDSADVINISMSSIDEPIESDDSASNVSNITLYNTYSSSTNDYEKQSDLEHIKMLVDTLLKDLSDRDREVMKMYFGIEQEHNTSVPVKIIAKRIGITPERVRQIVKDSKDKIKDAYSGKIKMG
jgi:RNA polymerase primary sigma factor